MPWPEPGMPSQAHFNALILLANPQALSMQRASRLPRPHVITTRRGLRSASNCRPLHASAVDAWSAAPLIDAESFL